MRWYLLLAWLIVALHGQIVNPFHLKHGCFSGNNDRLLNLQITL